MTFLPEYKGDIQSPHQPAPPHALQTEIFKQLLDEYTRGAPTPVEIPAIDWSKDYGIPGIDWDRKYGDEPPLFPVEPPVEPLIHNQANEPLNNVVEGPWGPPVTADSAPVYMAADTESDPVRQAFKRHLRRHNYWQDIKAKFVPGKLHYRYDTEERFEAFKQKRESKNQSWRNLGNRVLNLAEKAPSVARQKIGDFALRASHEVSQRSNELFERKEVRNSIVIGTLAMAAVTVASNFLQQKGVSAASLIPQSGSRSGPSGASHVVPFLPSKGSDHHINYASHWPHTTFEPASVHFDIQPGGNLYQSVHDTLAYMGVKKPQGATIKLVNYLQFQQGNTLDLVHSGDRYSVPLSTVKQFINSQP